jgi:uncharacterized repeat protein (TIGR01451 family)
MIILPVATWQATPVLSQDAQDDLPTWQRTLAELGYDEQVLGSPSGAVEYSVRLPEGWELDDESFFELDYSYIQEWLNVPGQDALPGTFGDLIVSIDQEIQQVVAIDETFIEHARLRIDLDLAGFNAPDQVGVNHSIKVTLDASSICNLAHRARLVVHPTSLLFLTYRQRPIPADLARYPRPFYQGSFETDKTRFVLSEQPTEAELEAAVGIAARLGSLTPDLAVSGTTDSMQLGRVNTETGLDEHLIVVGKPETNRVIERLNQMDVLPVSMQERQLELTTKGLAIVAPTDELTFTVTLTNTALRTTSSLSVVDSLPTGTDLVDCDPDCIQDEEQREIKWTVPSLAAGETASYAFRLRLSEAISDSVLENTAVLLAGSEPININTLTTTVRHNVAEEATPGPVIRSVSGIGDHFFVQDGQAVPEHDGIVQEIAAPWDQTRAILIITGLSDNAVSKAGRAMSFKTQFPSLQGAFALVQRKLVPLVGSTGNRGGERTLADLGYDDKLLGGTVRSASYVFTLPGGWQRTDSSYLELYFTHSQRIDYAVSSLTVFFNDLPIVTIPLDKDTALNGYIKANLPASQAQIARNQITVQSNLEPMNLCVGTSEWLFISSESRLYLAQDDSDLGLLLDSYPLPFSHRSNLEDVLLVLPSAPLSREWEEALLFAYALGGASGGSGFAPAVAFGDRLQSEAGLGDYHLIALGQPSRNWMLGRVNELLSQPFLPGLDQAAPNLDGVALRIPPGVSLGYVQLVPSPWNEDRALLAVTGTNEEGVSRAVHALVDEPWRLRGNLALIQENQIQTIDTRPLTRGGVETIVRTVVPGATSVVVTATPVSVAAGTPTSTPSGTATPTTTSMVVPTRVVNTVPQETPMPVWVTPLIAGAAIIIVAILIFAFWQSRQRQGMS